jgi:hypothetical protein
MSDQTVNVGEPEGDVNITVENVTPPEEEPTEVSDDDAGSSEEKQG